MTHTTTKLFELLLTAARAREGVVDDPPEGMVGSHLKSELWGATALDTAAERAEQDLPAIALGTRIDGTPLLFGVLGADASYELVREQLRRYHNQATIARSWLAADSPNLQLFLAGPEGSAGNSEWRDVAALVEADDRVCRKLVWLPRAEPDQSDAHQFLGRTFLASPWATQPERGAARLDWMSVVALPAGWDAALQDPALDADGFVARLVEASGE